MLPKTRRLAVLIVALATAASGQTRPADTRPATTQPASTQPAAPVQADAKARRVAERTLEAMGGRKAWDEVGVITWDFFGRRSHIWDKNRGLHRLEGQGPRGRYVIVVDQATGEGRMWRNGIEVDDPEDLDRQTKGALSAWCNDAYWLLMPYKLLDAGVKLRYLGAGPTEAGAMADMLEVTFDGVGITPNNKYHVYVGLESGLVEQWDYFDDADDRDPVFKLPWNDWKQYGPIKLSGNRGERDGRAWEITSIRVLDDVPESVFTDPAAVDLGPQP